MFSFLKCCFNVYLCKTRCEFGIAIMFRSLKFKNIIENVKKPGKRCFLVRKVWVKAVDTFTIYSA